MAATTARGGGWTNKVSWCVLWAVLGVYLLSHTARMNADPDLWGYLAFGRLFREGGFPYKDVFAFTPVKDVWVYHEWLLGVLYDKAVAQFGLAFLQWLKYAALLATLVPVVLVAVRRGGRQATAYCAILYVMPVFSMNASPVRAKVFSHLFFAVTVLVLELCRRKRFMYALWLLPLFAFWANLHGEVAVGFLALGAYGVGAFLNGERRLAARYALVLLGCFAASCVTPYGPAVWKFFLYAWGHSRPDILEWQSIFHFVRGNPDFGVFFATLALSVVVAALLGKGRREAISLLMLFGFLFAAAKSVRMLTYLCLAIILYVPAYLDAYAERLAAWFAPFRRAVLPCLALAALGYGVWQGAALWRRGIARIVVTDVAAHDPGAGFMYYSVDGLRHILATRRAGRIMPQFAWGEYLLWELPPSFKIGMDGRYETVYDDAYTDAYFAFVNGKSDAGTFLDKYGADIVVLKKSEKAWENMRRLPDWEEAFGNDGYSVFYRKTPIQEKPAS